MQYHFPMISLMKFGHRLGNLLLARSTFVWPIKFPF